MKKVIIPIFAIVILLAFISTSAQSLRIGAGGGITMFQSPDAFTDDLDKGGLGLASEYHFNGKLKFGFPVIPLSISGHVIYNTLSSEKSGTEISWNLLSLGVGAEYKLIPGPASPYLSLDLMMNSFGKLKVDDDEQEDTDISRYGIAIGAGLEFTLLPKVDIDASVKYNMFNLMGKEDEFYNLKEETIGAISINVTLLFGVL